MPPSFVNSLQYRALTRLSPLCAYPLHGVWHVWCQASFFGSPTPPCFFSAGLLSVGSPEAWVPCHLTIEHTDFPKGRLETKNPQNWPWDPSPPQGGALLVFLGIENLVANLGISCFCMKLRIPWAPQKSLALLLPSSAEATQTSLCSMAYDSLPFKPVPGATFSSV